MSPPITPWAPERGIQISNFQYFSITLGPQLGYRITVRKMFSQYYLYVNVNIQQIFQMPQIKSFYASLYCLLQNSLFNVKIQIPYLELFIHRSGDWSPLDRALQLTTHSSAGLLIPILSRPLDPQEPRSLRPWITTLQLSHPRGMRVRAVRFLFLISWCTLKYICALLLRLTGISNCPLSLEYLKLFH